MKIARTNSPATLQREMIVSKATSVYVIMIVVLVGGLWMILALGGTLIPPTDLAGKWELTSPGGTQTLSVEQSGKFINLVMGTWTANMKMQKDGGRATTQSAGIVLSENGETVTFGGLTISDTCTIQFDGSITGTYQAHREARAFK